MRSLGPHWPPRPALILVPPAAPQARRSGPSLAPAPQAPKPHVPPRFYPPNPAHQGLSTPSPQCRGPELPGPLPAGASPLHPAGLRSSFSSRPGPHPLTPLARASVRGPQPQPRPRGPILHAPPVPYPPANRCTSVSLWLILSPACPPGAESRTRIRPPPTAGGFGSGLEPHSTPGTARGAGGDAAAKGNRLGPPAACSRAASNSSSALTTGARESRGCRRRVGAGA